MPRIIAKKSKAPKVPATKKKVATAPKAKKTTVAKKTAAKPKPKKAAMKKPVKSLVKTKKPVAKPKARKIVIVETTKPVKEKAPAKVKKVPTKRASIPLSPPLVGNAPVVATKNIYLSNKELLAEVKRAKKMEVMTNQLARMLQLLCGKYAKKGNFVNYTYNEDMQAYAMLMLVRTWKSFDPEKSDNPFAFFTQCIKNSFIQYLNQEKRQRNVRDLLLVDQGMNPSFGFADDLNEKHVVDDEEDYQAMQDLIKSKAAALEELTEADVAGPAVAPVTHIDPASIDKDEYASI